MSRSVLFRPTSLIWFVYLKGKGEFKVEKVEFKVDINIVSLCLCFQECYFSWRW